jgi:transposase
MSPVDLASLPDDPAILRTTIEQLAAQLADARRRIEVLSYQIAQLRRHAYGRKSEKVVVEQLLLAFDGLKEEIDELARRQEQAEETMAAVEKAATAGHGRRRLPKDLPRETVKVTVPEADRACPECGGERAPIGAEIAERYEYRPASVVVQVVEREKLACKTCQAHVVTAEPPPAPLAKAQPGPGMLAHIITNKYADHLPLYRQEDILARQGAPIARSTMVGWLVGAARELRPIADAMHKDVLGSPFIHADDIPVPVLDPLRDETREGRLWLYSGDRDHPHDVYRFSPDRRGEHPQRHLEGYKGFLVADAYAGFNALFANGSIVEVACWAHARRKAFDARVTDSVTASTFLAWVRKLYDVEDLAKGLDNDARRALRQEKSVPLLAGFKTWLDEVRRKILPQSPMGQAIAYTLNLWDALNRYVEHGFLPIDNNAAERALRCVAVGRKNWEFAGSDDGGHRAAVFYTLVSTCKRHGVDPWAYLSDVLMRVATTPLSRIEHLFPHRWKAARLAKLQDAAAAVAAVAGTDGRQE